MLAFVAGLGVFAGSCAPESGTSGAGINVVATTTQIGALTRAVAGDHVRLTVLLPSGADAHDFEPDPQDVKEVHEAKLVLRNGIGLDDWMNRTIDNAGGSARVVVVTDGVKLLRSNEGGAESDPHVWHDPENAAVMVENIASALAAADPSLANTFTANAQAYRARLEEVDREVRQLIDAIPVENRKMVTNHDAFGYFIAHYGLEFVGAVFPNSAKEGQASAKELAALSDLIRAQGVKAVFAEEEVDPKVARELARDTGVRVVTGLYADSLGPRGSGADTIDGMLLANARKISEALR